MADAFYNMPDDLKKESTRMVSEASTNLIHGMGNVLETFSFSAAEVVEKEDHKEKNETRFSKEKVSQIKNDQVTLRDPTMLLHPLSTPSSRPKLPKVAPTTFEPREALLPFSLGNIMRRMQKKLAA